AFVGGVACVVIVVGEVVPGSAALNEYDIPTDAVPVTSVGMDFALIFETLPSANKPPKTSSTVSFVIPFCRTLSGTIFPVTSLKFVTTDPSTEPVTESETPLPKDKPV